MPTMPFPRNVSRAALLILALLVQAAAGTVHAQGNAHYRNTHYGWSIQYPADWRLDDDDPGFVRIMSDELQALCGVSSYRGERAMPGPDELADYMMSVSDRDLGSRGFTQQVTRRASIVLPNEVTATDITVNIVPGGKSRRIFATAQTRLLILDCETYAENWPRVQTIYDRIVRSFTIER